MVDGLLTGDLLPEAGQDRLLDVRAVVLGEAAPDAPYGGGDEPAVVAHQRLQPFDLRRRRLAQAGRDEVGE